VGEVTRVSQWARQDPHGDAGVRVKTSAGIGRAVVVVCMDVGVCVCVCEWRDLREEEQQESSPARTFPGRLFVRSFVPSFVAVWNLSRAHRMHPSETDPTPSVGTSSVMVRTRGRGGAEKVQRESQTLLGPAVGASEGQAGRQAGRGVEKNMRRSGRTPRRRLRKGQGSGSAHFLSHTPGSPQASLETEGANLSQGLGLVFLVLFSACRLSLALPTVTFANRSSSC
jgi:hypothetical protein